MFNNIFQAYEISIERNGEVVIKSTLERIQLRQSFFYYEAASGYNRRPENRASGAYIFRPKTPNAKRFSYTGNYRIFHGLSLNFKTSIIFLILQFTHGEK